MERIEKFNLEVALFINELNSYIENVNEINDETIKLLTETIIGINNLQINSIFRETSSSNESAFVNNLNEDIFKCRRFIVCCLCHEQIPPSSEDFNAHVRKRDHQEKEHILKLAPPNRFEAYKMNDDYTSERKANTPDGSMAQNGSREKIIPNPTAKLINAANVIKPPGIMMMAKISDDDSKKLNQIVSSSSIEKSADENTLKLSHVRSPSSTSSTLSLNSASAVKNSVNELNKASAILKNKLRDVIVKMECKNSNDCGSKECSDINGKTIANANKIVCSTMDCMKRLEDVISISDVLKSAQSEMDQILSPSISRLKSEQEIIGKLSGWLLNIDSAITGSATVSKFGSVTYGFGGTSTNFNILVTAETISTCNALKTTLANSFGTSGLQQDFEFLCHIKPNRVQYGQLKVLHKKSSIQCVIKFQDAQHKSRYLKQSRIILDYMSLHPICKQLIAFIKAWQNVLNKQAMKHGLVAFNMNTYIIAMLVIFYLQLNHGLPIVTELDAAIAANMKFLSKNKFNEFVKEFFEFYARKFEPKSHLISINVGKWQQKIQTEQKNTQVDIISCPNNWENCAMWVQDAISPSTNITAEITKQEVENFVRMCRVFAEHTERSDGVLGPSMLNSSHVTDLIRLIEKDVSDSRVTSHSDTRKRFEVDIVSMLKKYINEFDPSLKLYPFGSSQFGVRATNTNFNLLISTNGRKPNYISQRFYFKLEKTDISRHFTELHKITADRVMKKQINMIHIKSGIQCRLVFERDHYIVQSTQIINRFAAEPICNFLITFIRTWQITLNRLEISRFKFNTYIISILVIFFLQMDYNFPTTEETAINICSTMSNFKLILKEFFNFYGNRYQITNHVISTQIGRWEERQSQPEQVFHTPAQTRLRNGIKTCPENWQNCTMYVQDLVRPEVNVAAEISKKEAENFQQMCQIFGQNI